MATEWARHGVLVLAMLAPVSTELGTSAAQQPPCCIELEPTLEGVVALLQVDWQPLDRRRLNELWRVAATPCEPVPWERGLEGVAAFKDRCCNSCGMCGGQLVTESVDKSLVSLRLIGAMMCRNCGANPDRIETTY